jgi:dipeptidyl aminopeptidase/acylaminoacyl peptidase
MKTLFACTLAALLACLAGAVRSAEAAFPGQNGKIAFASNRSGSFDIYASNSDGSGLADLTATPGIDEFEPAWSPDGRRLAYRRDGAIWVMNADGSAQTPLTGGSAVGEFAKEPTWSPDGRQIAFSRLDSVLGIWTVADGGGPEHQLTTTRDESPAWSPGGGAIAVERHPAGAADRLVLVDVLTGSESDVVTGISSSNDNPSWSPDGTKIAFDANGGEGLDIVDLSDGSVHAFGFGSDPEWAPDGSAIVYTLRDPSSEVEWRPWPDDGSGARRITGDDPATDRSPSWQPASENTPAGSNVSVALGPVTITFANVAVAGETTAVSATSGPPVPSFFQVASDYYELSTTATWDQAAGAEICFTYSGSPAPQIVHFVGGTAVLVPATATGRQVCGTVDSFSPFVLVRPLGDTVAPTLSLPGTLTVNATSQAGAVVTYAASATDDSDPSPVVSCAPAGGSVFAIGETTVICTATDRSGNSSSASFTVKVKGAKEQLGDLIQKVVSASSLSPSAKTLLIGKLNQLLASFDPSNPTQRQTVCLALQAFKAAVQLQAGKTITQARAAEWIADATRIRAVLGC